MTERALFDVRVEITADDRDAVFATIRELVSRARDIAPPGATVRYSQLRPAKRSRSFEATIEPQRRRARSRTQSSAKGG